MTKLKQLKKVAQEVSKLEQSETFLKLKARKADARHKIELGGLVVKAGLSKESKAIILGLVLSGKNSLDHEPGARELFKSLGDRAFMSSDDKK